MKDFGSIGFFDSGVGGATIWNEVVSLLPGEKTVYIADSINAPYGVKSPEEIIDLSITNSKRLIEEGAKIIVVACNTATTQAIDVLRDKFDVPFVGIEPAIKPAAMKSKTRSISVLATHGTLESEHFNRTKDKYTQDVELITREGEGLVKAIEGGMLGTQELKNLLKSHLDALMRPDTDHLVLGCTHYPLLKSDILQLIPSSVMVVDSGRAVALRVLDVLREMGNLNEEINPIHRFMSSGNLDVLKSIVDSLTSNKEIVYSSLYQSE